MGIRSWVESDTLLPSDVVMIRRDDIIPETNFGCDMMIADDQVIELEREEELHPDFESD